MPDVSLIWESSLWQSGRFSFSLSSYRHSLSSLCEHLFALPNKIDLPQFEYPILRGIYYGWEALEILLPAGAIASAALAAVARHHNLPLWLATLAALCFIVMLIVSFIWTFPANHATDNWMTLPKDGKR
ncbi:MAG: hypothetical protein WBA15_03130 [Mesorhizobium sp.]